MSWYINKSVYKIEFYENEGKSTMYRFLIHFHACTVHHFFSQQTFFTNLHIKNDAMHLLLLPENPAPMIIFRQDGCRSRIKSVSGDIWRKHCKECVYSERLMMCSRYVHVWKTVLWKIEKKLHQALLANCLKQLAPYLNFLSLK